MKIMQVVHAYPPHNTAGVEVYTQNLCQELSKRHRVSIFHRVCEPKRKEYEVRRSITEGLPVYTVNNTFKHCYSFKGLYVNEEISDRFESIIEEIKPDIIHIQSLVFLSASIIQRIKKMSLPVVFTLHDYWLICPQWHYLKPDLSTCDEFNPENCLSCVASWLSISKKPKQVYHLLNKFLPKIPQLTARLRDVYVSMSKNTADADRRMQVVQERMDYMQNLCRRVDLFISPSEFLRQKFTEFGIPKEKNSLLRHGLRKSAYQRNIAKKDSNFTFGFIGTLLPSKGAHILISAFNRINNKDVRLKIYGNLIAYAGFEYYPRYLKKISGHNRQIEFMGAFDNNRIEEVLSTIDVLVAPSIWLENSPLVIQEAFLSNTPVIASRIGGIPELVNDGVNGLLFNPGDIRDLKEKLEYIINNSEVINKLKDNSPKVKNIEENAKEMEEAYANLIIKNK